MQDESTFENWRRGRGMVQHDALTCERVATMAEKVAASGSWSHEEIVELLMAADRLCNAGMWLTVHMTYARQVYLDGRELGPDDFKTHPEGHTGGALNMVPAYVGYLLANALSGRTRAWMMGQGHCVAAVDAVNVLMRNLEAEQEERYPLNDEGLSRLCQDFYSYEVAPDGQPAAPLGSHVNVFTAGGVSEGGYLGFAELQYVHMPLPGQELVAFLSDGAFEEQRGSDWAARWWRGEDTGLVMPVMIANGRRIDQRTTMSQSGGVQWFRDHLQLNGFDPIDIDGRDPAAFAWLILEMAERLQDQHGRVSREERRYPVLLPYGIAETVKGYGFPGAGTNASHNLPLGGNPKLDPALRDRFNEGAARLHMGPDELREAVERLSSHSRQHRVRERDHCLRRYRVPFPELPVPQDARPGATASPMAWVDEWFCRLVESNPGHRIRVGNPDEMRSNRMNRTLDFLHHRVTSPESGVAESLCGSVITALNEESVVSAAFANKQGLSMAVSYEAFAVKMLGAMRQEVIFARHMAETGRDVPWISVPVIATSHTWENGKNEMSHQDPTLSEAWMGEMSDMAPVYFPFDANTSVAVLRSLYGQRGRVAVVVAAKGELPVILDGEQAAGALEDGAVTLTHDDGARIQLLALGAYQLLAVQRAADVLRTHGVACSVVGLVEPGRFREPRDNREGDYVHDDAGIERIIPHVEKRLFVSHTRAEPMTGVLRRLDTGPRSTRFLGYRNRGGTLDTFGMLFANRQTWAHIVSDAAALLDEDCSGWFTSEEKEALDGLGSPDVLR